MLVVDGRGAAEVADGVGVGVGDPVAGSTGVGAPSRPPASATAPVATRATATTAASAAAILV